MAVELIAALLAGLGGAGKGIREEKDRALKERETKVREQGEERERHLGGLQFMQTILRDIKDPARARAMLNAAKPSLDSLGIDMSDLSSALETIPGSGPLAEKYIFAPAMERARIAAELHEKGMGNLMPALDEARRDVERALVSTEAGALQQAQGLGRTEAVEAARTSVAPSVPREQVGLQPLPAMTPAETGAQAKAASFGKVKGDWEADPERRQTEIDLLRAQAAAAKRDPVGNKTRLQSEALNAWYKIGAGEPLTPDERRWGLLEEPELARFIVGGDVNSLDAVLSGMASQRITERGGKPSPRQPILPPVRANAPSAVPKELPKASEHKGKTFEDSNTGKHYKSDGTTWSEVR